MLLILFASLEAFYNGVRSLVWLLDSFVVLVLSRLLEAEVNSGVTTTPEFPQKALNSFKSILGFHFRYVTKTRRACTCSHLGMKLLFPLSARLALGLYWLRRVTC